MTETKDKEICEEIVIPTVGSLGKKVFIQELKNNIDSIKSISTVYQKKDDNTRYKITVIVSEEPDYTEV